ncbi:MAG: hypothetical protein VW799_09365, partial [Halieaceae bacterium]
MLEILEVFSIFVSTLSTKLLDSLDLLDLLDPEQAQPSVEQLEIDPSYPCLDYSALPLSSIPPCP